MAADETRWLDGDEADAMRRPLVSVLLTLPAALDAQLQRQSNLTFYEFVVLTGLERAGAPDSLIQTRVSSGRSAGASRAGRRGAGGRSAG